MEFRESLISAHHNYLVNRMLAPGFLLGDVDGEHDFRLLADVLSPEEKTPFLAARFYDQEGGFLMEMSGDRMVENPGGCRVQASGDGFMVFYPSGEVLLAVRTEAFANGFLTRIQGRLYDRKGLLRMEPSFDSGRIVGEAWRILAASVRAKNGNFCP